MARLTRALALAGFAGAALTSASAGAHERGGAGPEPPLGQGRSSPTRPPSLQEAPTPVEIPHRDLAPPEHEPLPGSLRQQLIRPISASGGRSPVEDQTFGVSGMFSVGAILPWGRGYADSVSAGMALDMSIWGDLPYGFVLQARVGLRFDMVLRTNGYLELPVDVGVFYTLGGNGIHLLFGGGIGGRHFWETRGERLQVGSILYAQTDIESKDHGWGFGVYGRIGLLVRNRRRRRGGIVLSAEVSNSFIALNGHGDQTAVVLSTGFVY